MNILDLVLRPELVRDAWRYFEEEQTADRRYRSFIRGGNRPAIHLNRERMERWRPEMRKYYYDPSKYDTYLEQPGSVPNRRAAQQPAPPLADRAWRVGPLPARAPGLGDEREMSPHLGVS